MNKRVAVLAFAGHSPCAAGLNSGGGRPSSALRCAIMPFGQEQLFEALAIRVPRRRAAPYFFGDNVEGYFEGQTHRTAEGAGYLLHGRALFRDFLSWRGELFNERTKAEGAAIYPYGIRHDHGPSWWDELMLLRRQQAVALRAFSRQPQTLALAPLLDLAPRHLVVQAKPWGGFITDRKKTFCVGVSSSQPFRHDGTVTRGRLVAPVFRTLQDESEFTLYLAFDRDPRRAQGRVLALREADGVRRHKAEIFGLLTRSHLWTDDEDYNRALMWAKLSSLFLVENEFGQGIWAGLPWFKNNWGRDTFIALPGTLLVSGMFDEAREVIRNFVRWQNTDKDSPDYGRVPNRVTGTRAADKIYNTADGTPWLIRELYEYLCYTGDRAFGEEVYPFVRTAIAGALKHHGDKQGFLTHADADTWMDARIEGKEPWSARGSRAVEIQALWFNALLAGARLADLVGDAKSAREWALLAAKVRKSFAKKFWDARGRRLADRLRPDGTADFKVRPNQLMAISVPMIEPLVDDATAARVTANACGELLYPHGIGSLSQDDPYFHPIHHREESYHFDAAYHNGIVWGWNAGPAVTALCRCGQTELAGQLARNLAAQILEQGCRGAMSELVDAWPDAKGKLVLSGCWAQAWSSAEFARNGYQDFGGFEPRLLDGRIVLRPRFPAAWTRFAATFPFGRGASLQLTYANEHGKEVFVLTLDGKTDPLTVSLDAVAGGFRFVADREMKSADTWMLVIEKGQALSGLNGRWEGAPVKGRKQGRARPLGFVRLDPRAKPPSLKKKDYLKDIILAGRYR
ncbi:MAG TPA: amylo-alpha-1,6-glucosidase [Kiritimatiellia bacterium]|nr:amylo-alpha-1,6-glucosidase [Kiritimatiellia bacterium]HRZ12424.1 amylo-alpha-1,6-glucosidase [Kiritimatiellia bacterium]HSA17818.1 amylo-alpha-1,6-glucosidase [Kiritimatiellia bacterium]